VEATVAGGAGEEGRAARHGRRHEIMVTRSGAGWAAAQPRPARASMMDQTLILVDLPKDLVHQVGPLKRDNSSSIRQNFGVECLGHS